jgi:hypothetical protein
MAGTQYDKVTVAGQLSLDGMLVLSIIDNFTPAAGNSFDVLDWGSLTGTFAALQLPAVAGGLSWNTSQLYVSGSISVAGVLGDYNHNGVVDAADYTVWRDSLGQSGTGLAADGDTGGASAGVIDQADYFVWKNNFGNHAGSASGNAVAVPEPSAVLLLANAGVLVGAFFGKRCGAPWPVR